MDGQFIFSTAQRLGLTVRAFIRNTGANGDTMLIEQRPALSVDLRVFEGGQLARHNPQFATIPYGEVQEISLHNCPELHSPAGSDRLVVARCSFPSEKKGYFAQGHQLIYSNPQSGKFTSLIYDQLPLLPANARPSPIILLAPKIWVSRQVNSFVVFANGWDTLEPARQPEPLVLTLLDEKGQTVLQQEQVLWRNDSWIFDAREALKTCRPVTENAQFYTLVARGGASTYAILTFIMNSDTGNLALEHSLAPAYYLTGALARVRNEALTMNPASMEAVR